MPFILRMVPVAEAEYQALEHNPAQVKRLKAVRKALAYLQQNPRACEACGENNT